jgi:hypothetical protein
VNQHQTAGERRFTDESTSRLRKTCHLNCDGDLDGGDKSGIEKGIRRGSDAGGLGPREAGAKKPTTLAEREVLVLGGDGTGV